MRFITLAYLLLQCHLHLSYAEEITATTQNHANKVVRAAAAASSSGGANAKLQGIDQCLVVDTTDPTKAAQEVQDCMKGKGLSVDGKLCSKKRRKRDTPDTRSGKRAVNAAAKFLKRHGQPPTKRFVPRGEKPTKTFNVLKRVQSKNPLSSAAQPVSTNEMIALTEDKTINTISDVPEEDGSKTYGMTITCDTKALDTYQRTDVLTDSKDSLCKTISDSLVKQVDGGTKALKDLTPDIGRGKGDAYQDIQTTGLSGLTPVKKTADVGFHVYLKPEASTSMGSKIGDWATKICGAVIDAFVDPANGCAASKQLSTDSDAGEHYAIQSGYIELTSDGKEPAFDTNSGDCTNCVAAIGVVAPDDGREDETLDEDENDVVLIGAPTTSGAPSTSSGVDDSCDVD